MHIVACVFWACFMLCMLLSILLAQPTIILWATPLQLTRRRQRAICKLQLLAWWVGQKITDGPLRFCENDDANRDHLTEYVRTRVMMTLYESMPRYVLLPTPWKWVELREALIDEFAASLLCEQAEDLGLRSTQFGLTLQGDVNAAVDRMLTSIGMLPSSNHPLSSNMHKFTTRIRKQLANKPFADTV